jgi:photosystem II stability/assembly factor-like uncharacterized protein
VLFTGAQAVAVGDRGIFLVSADAGDSWTAPPAEPGASTSHTNYSFTDVRCASATVCLIATAPSTVFRTTDRGRSFTEVGDDGNALDYASATRAVVVGFAGRTQISDDGGASFADLGQRVFANLGVRATSANIA